MIYVIFCIFAVFEIAKKKYDFIVAGRGKSVTSYRTTSAQKNVGMISFSNISFTDNGSAR